MVQNGYARAMTHLAGVALERPGCEILFETVVSGVQEREGSVVVLVENRGVLGVKGTEGTEGTEAAREMVFDSVVCTLPLGVLQHSGEGDVRWDPPLPPALLQSMGRLNMGLLHKTYVCYVSCMLCILLGCCTGRGQTSRQTGWVERDMWIFLAEICTCHNCVFLPCAVV